MTEHAAATDHGRQADEDLTGVSPLVRGLRAKGRHRPGSGGHAISDAITRFSGSMTFVWLHVAWFGLWIIVNLTVPHPFDPFPFGLLTLVVSLEAIFLSTFVLISQNQQGAESDRRAAEDFETNLYSEALSELIAEKLGINRDDVTRRYRNLVEQTALTPATKDSTSADDPAS